MSKCSMLLLAAAAIVGGCTRDAPLVAPITEAVDAKVTRSVALDSPAFDQDAGAIEDAVARLLPALDAHGATLRSALLMLSANRGNRAARDDLDVLLTRLASTLPERYLADFDALRLDLGVTSK